MLSGSFRVINGVGKKCPKKEPERGQERKKHMLKLYNLEGQENCWKIGRKFVNDRLIRMMEDVIVDYAQLVDTSYMQHITSSDQWEAPLDTVLDLKRMRRDLRFAGEALDWRFPAKFESLEELSGAFWRLYDLLVSAS